MRPLLLLFDIDGTLLDTRGSGAGALMDAAEQVLGVTREQMPPLDLAGATDKGVVRKLFADARQPLTEDQVRTYCECYLGHLQRRLSADTFAGKLLPAVPDLLKALTTAPHVHRGLLTGNLRQGAQMKLERFQIAHHFTDGAFGDDAEDRNLLGPVALERMRQKTGISYAADQVIVIGDTPKDVACARAFGARCIAVATGAFSSEQLRSHQPWQCLEDFTDLEAVLPLLTCSLP